MGIISLLFVLFTSPAQSQDIVTPDAVQKIAARQVFLYTRNGKPAAFPKRDKVLHCGVSCVLCNEYGPGQAAAVGVLKEVADALGAGDPSWENLSADMVGVIYGTKIAPGDSADEFCATTCQDHFILN